MKARIERKGSGGCEADLQAPLGTLFRRHPELCGFSLRDAAGLTGDDALALCRALAAALFALLERRPQAAPLLRSRSLPRTLH